MKLPKKTYNINCFIFDVNEKILFKIYNIFYIEFVRFKKNFLDKCIYLITI